MRCDTDPTPSPCAKRTWRKQSTRPGTVRRRAQQLVSAGGTPKRGGNYTKWSSRMKQRALYSTLHVLRVTFETVTLCGEKCSLHGATPIPDKEVSHVSVGRLDTGDAKPNEQTTRAVRKLYLALTVTRFLSNSMPLSSHNRPINATQEAEVSAQTRNTHHS